ncbi:MAG: DUF6175 family protein [Brevinematales bacterium]|nr:DUF6175 family protein [Brevinematales bacterium]
MRRVFLCVLILVSFLVFGCSEPRQTKENTKISHQEQVGFKSYEVEGEGEEYFEARKNAIASGIRKAVIEIVGDKKYRSNYDEIEVKIVQDKKVVNQVSEFTSTKIFDRNNKKVVSGITKVNLDLLKSYLDVLNLEDNGKLISQPQRQISKELQSSKIYKQDDSSVSFTPSDNSPIMDISFLVFVPTEKLSYLESDENYKIFIELINSKLSEYGLNYVDFKRALDLSKKFYSIYEEKTGHTMSLMQMLAQELKADVYIEADINVKTSLIIGNLPDITIVSSIKSYDASTGKGLGTSTTTKSKRSKMDYFQSRVEVMNEIVEQEIPKILKNVDDYFSEGIPINVVIVGFSNVSEEKEFSAIFDSLPGISTRRRKSISGNTSEYDIVYKGGASYFVDDLIEVISAIQKYSKVKIDQSVNKVIINLK